MSEFKLISPLLDNFEMGDPISCHNGVSCCPAMEKNSDNKYIVKIISIPASQVQLDALLLTGAYPNAESANAYFKELSTQVTEEAAALQKLAGLEGFVPYEKWQVVPMEEGNGYNIYLLGQYRRTLEQLYKKQPMTQLGAINLGLDLCAAMAVCRHSGYLYIALKPNNISIEENKGYRVFDLGLVKLNALKYASMPDRYFSQYTAPEIEDAFSTLNATIDIYSIGLILYQAYNGGLLPFRGERAPAEAFPPPAYADYEMAEIILKACAPNPEDRWQDPIQMGQALVSYMQRNGANDVPIIPVVQDEEPFEEYVPAEIPEDESATAQYEPDVVDDPQQESFFGEVEETEPEVSDCQLSEEASDTDKSTNEQPQLPADDISEAFTENNPCEEDFVNPLTENPDYAEPSESVQATEESAPTDSDTDTLIIPAIPDEAEINNLETEAEQNAENNTPEDAVDIADPETDLSFLTELDDDETIPSAEEAEDDYNLVSDEVSEILSYADELLAHPIPEPVVAPDPIDVPIPDPIVIPSEADEMDTSKEDSIVAEDENIVVPDFANRDEADNFPAPTDLTNAPDDVFVEESVQHSGSWKKWVAAIVLLLLTAAAAFLGFYYYQHYYLQPVTISTMGTEDSLVVYVTSSIAENKLTVLCADTYGNSLYSPVIDGKATFTDLAPGSGYTISVEVEGFHRLTGNTSTAYSTPVQTNVVQFTAIAGPEDGSVILSFAIDGPDSQQWSVRYTAESEPTKAQPFSGHMVTVVGLTVGKEYTFTLESENSVYITGNNQLIWLAEKNILAENLEITGCDNNRLTANWNAPEGVSVESWSVRCYNDSGFDETIKVDTTTAVFENIDHTKGYTVEVTAANMTVSSRTYISANSMTVTGFEVDSTDPQKLILSWDTTHPLTNGNWIVLYSADDLDIHEVSGTAENQVVIQPLIPNATYSFTLMTTSGSYVFHNTYKHTVGDAPKFNNYNVKAENMEFNMCKTPDVLDWDRNDLKAEDYKTTFAVGEKASFLIRVRNQYNPLNDNIVSMFVIRDKTGAIVKMSTSEEAWINMWYKGYCELDIPVMPDSAGEYTITVYFNGYYAGERTFTITAA